MMRWAMLAAVICLGAAAGDEPAGDAAAQLPRIRQALASAEFPVREAAQKELDGIPATQVEVLRTAAKQEVDPEVKARLEQRIDAMEVYTLLHPQPLSLTVKDADLKAVADEMNRQLGTKASPEPVQSSGFAQGDIFTLDLRDKPFGEIIEELNRQKPINVGCSLSVTSSGIAARLQLQRLPGGAPEIKWAAHDAFAFGVRTSGAPATGQWVVQVQGISDPRIRIAQYSSVLTISKVTDQDGRSLMPLVLSRPGAIARPTIPSPAFSSTAVFAPASGVTKIGELQGQVSISLQSSEKKISFDVDHPPDKPIQTARGPMTVTSNGGVLMLNVGAPADGAAPAAQAARPVPILVEATSADRQRTATALFAGTSLNLTNLLRTAGPGATVTITLTESTRDCVLPVELKDIELPQPVLRNANIGGGQLETDIYEDGIWSARGR